MTDRSLPFTEFLRQLAMGCCLAVYTTTRITVITLGLHTRKPHALDRSTDPQRRRLLARFTRKPAPSGTTVPLVT